MPKEADIKFVAKQVRNLADYSDMLSSENDYWRINDIANRMYEIIPFWMLPNEIVKETAELSYENDITSARDTSRIRDKSRIFLTKNDSKGIPLIDLDTINRFLRQKGYFFDYGKGSYGKTCYTLACIQEHHTTDGIHEIILGNELVCNHPLGIYAFTKASPYNPIIIGRTKGSEFIHWLLILSLRDKQKSPDVYFLLKGFELLGIERDELLRGNPREIAKKVIGIANIDLKESTLPHERGHIEARVYLPQETINNVLNLSRSHEDTELEHFIGSLDEILADSIKENSIKGKYPSILELKERQRDGLLYKEFGSRFGIHYTPYPFSGLDQTTKLEYPIIEAMIEYENTKDLKVLEDAITEVFHGGVSLAKEINENRGYQSLVGIMNKTNREYEKGYENAMEKQKQFLRNKRFD